MSIELTPLPPPQPQHTHSKRHWLPIRNGERQPRSHVEFILVNAHARTTHAETYAAGAAAAAAVPRAPFDPYKRGKSDESMDVAGASFTGEREPRSHLGFLVNARVHTEPSKNAVGAAVTAVKRAPPALPAPRQRQTNDERMQVAVVGSGLHPFNVGCPLDQRTAAAAVATAALAYMGPFFPSTPRYGDNVVAIPTFKRGSSSSQIDIDYVDDGEDNEVRPHHRSKRSRRTRGE